ncbi:MAG: RsmB/NOP family class I SAM-dependent RNA methyltransferase [Sphingomonas bacterium]|nr:RsmB/NOP family class I SAM-dependent RNA methyltransferase [Sphingomonas bacterium]
MTPTARVQAAIEILDTVIAAARDDGPPADVIVGTYFKTRRYAGSTDRRAVRELVYRAIRRSGDRPDTGRAAMLGLDDAAALFGDGGHGPGAIGDNEQVAGERLIPAWIEAELSPLVTEDEWPALLERAPLDVRVHTASIIWAELLAAFPGSERTRLSPWGIRLPSDSQIEQHPAFLSGQIEVQDEGSQLIALACGATDDCAILDLCAGAGGKSLALAAAAPGADIIACDNNRGRLSKLAPRAARAHATIETRLLDGGREAEQLADLEGQADIVLVDAPCSGSGTWRRNPEGRWRLSPDSLDKVVALQAHLLDLAVPLVKPGGVLVYAVCSILAREGAGQIADFLGRHSSWGVQPMPDGFGDDFGRVDGDGRLLTPGHDRTDGFFVARLGRPC